MKKELDIYIRARYPLLWIVTPEEERALVEIEALAKEQKKRLLFWSGTTGLSNPAQVGRIDASKKDPLVLLTTILEDEDKCIWVLRDLHPYLRSEAVVRRLREVSFGLKTSNKTVILLGPVLKIPAELEKEVTVLDFNLPTAEQIDARIRKGKANRPGVPRKSANMPAIKITAPAAAQRPGRRSANQPKIGCAAAPESPNSVAVRPMSALLRASGPLNVANKTPV